VRAEPRLAPPYPLQACDRGILESALAAPGIGWGPSEKYPDLPAKSAALLYALGKSQACTDGNKRVALLLTLAFVQMNGGRLVATPDEIVSIVLEVAESDARERDTVVTKLTEWMRAHVVAETEGAG